MDAGSSKSTKRRLATEPACSLRIGGLTALSTTDYPGRLAAVIFCQGCTWSCAYCHNPHLLPQHSAQGMTWNTVHSFLERRRGLLDAVVFSGGEPTLQSGLPAAITEVKEMGYEVGLHTAGIYPQRLSAVLPLLDWIAMDIKAPLDDYARITGVAGSGKRVLESLIQIIAINIPHEFRTTVHQDLLTSDAILDIANTLQSHGARCYALQEFREQGCGQDSLKMQAPARHIDAALAQAVSSRFEGFEVRHA
jgi:pyruvate formate lyase activating enzyme